MSRFKAVIFDWAGTMVDFGSFAPVAALVAGFADFGVTVSVAQARGPMGLPKRDHISALLADPALAAAWQAAQGRAPDAAAVDRVLAAFVTRTEAAVARHAALVPGAAEVLAHLARAGIRVGSTTGYTRAIMARLQPLAAAQGFAPEAVVCADDVVEGRPGALQMYRCLSEMRVYPPSAVIKVDDTEPGIAEGLAVGALTVGVALSGNLAGLTVAELAALAPEARAALRAQAAARLRVAGAHHVIDTVADLPALITRLELVSDGKSGSP